MATLNGREFGEISGSPVVRVLAGGDTIANRTFVCDWADRFLMAKDLVGNWDITGAPVWTPPQEFPGDDSFFADGDTEVIDCVVLPYFGPEAATGGNVANTTSPTQMSGTALYKWAAIEVTYGLKEPISDSGIGFTPPSVPAGTKLEVQGDFNSQVITTNSKESAWQWIDTPVRPVPTNINIAKRIGIQNYIIRWSRVPKPPWDEMRKFEGNIGSISILGNDGDTVKYNGAKFTKQSHWFNNVPLYIIDYSFSVRERPWNEFFDPDTAQWLQVQTTASGSNRDPFDAVNLNDLFAFGA